MTPVVVDRLKKDGFRITPIRRSIIEILTQNHSPVTASDILGTLHKKHPRINKTTVYREIAFLLEQNLLEEIDLGEGKKRYDLVANKGHHHHAICERCGAIQDIPLQDTSFLQSVERQTQFKIERHTLEFFGVCGACQV